MQLTITLHIDHINAALAALAKLPYEQAQPHIDAIRDRASAALQAANAEADFKRAADEAQQRAAAQTAPA